MLASGSRAYIARFTEFLRNRLQTVALSYNIKNFIVTVHLPQKYPRVWSLFPRKHSTGIIQQNVGAVHNDVRVRVALWLGLE